jgi:L-ascorbate metabolism protein UlaG (beta-lactamase superfamily)
MRARTRWFTDGMLRLVRHATLQLEAGGRRFLVDPMLGPAGGRPPVANTPNPVRNPLVELPEPAEGVVAWADAVLVTHLHADHLDDEAVALIGDRLPVFCQPGDVEALHARGLVRAAALHDAVSFDGVSIARTGGRHGTGEIAEQLGPVSGFVIDGSTYIAGDTVWCDEVATALTTFSPTLVVVNAGGARFLEGDPITMTAADVAAVCDAAPAATVVAVHCEAINHCVETRAELAAAVGSRGVRIPADGEVAA